MNINFQGVSVLDSIQNSYAQVTQEGAYEIPWVGVGGSHPLKCLLPSCEPIANSEMGPAPLKAYFEIYISDPHS